MVNTFDNLWDLHDVYWKLRSADADRDFRTVLFSNAKFDEIELGHHGTSLDDCVLRVIPWGFVVVVENPQPRLYPKQLDVLTKLDSALGGQIIHTLRSVEWEDSQLRECNSYLADLIEDWPETRDSLDQQRLNTARFPLRVRTGNWVS